MTSLSLLASIMSTASSSYSSKEERLRMVMKGKRTKRQRLHPPSALTASSTTSSTGNYTVATEEEEDMANCLILLAQGPNLKPKMMVDEVNGRSVTDDLTPVSGGFHMYECKTCFKRFPSFQALGGHRTSHKKPKLAPPPPIDEVNNKLINEDCNLQMGISPISIPIVVGSNHNKPRIHECSICGSEFSSGQALGGHMRRHRPVVIPGTTTTALNMITTTGSMLQEMKERSILSLDLNLPAPSDDDHGENPTKSPSESSTTTSTFGGGIVDPSSLLFTALVGCHY